MKQIAAILQCYKNKKATDFVLKNFRLNFKDSPIVLISDGGEDFSDLAETHKAKYFYLNQNFSQALPYNSHRMIEWWRRQKIICDLVESDYILILEDDVFVQKQFFIQEDFALRGVKNYNFYPQSICSEIREKGKLKDINFDYGMCGGGIYNRKIFLSIYEDVINDIGKNHDEQLKDPNYFLIGAIDSNIVYHFNKRGFVYERSPWLSEKYSCYSKVNSKTVHINRRTKG